MRLFWAQQYTDLGPFRAIRRRTLENLDMRDKDYGWTVEMQIKAARQNVRAIEVPVQYRRRIGKSKVSGTLRGVVGAGTKILWTIFLAALQPRAASPDVLTIFTRYPQPGRTKTRLIPALGAEGAAQLQREMTEHALQVASEFADETSASVQVRFADGTRSQMRDWLGDGPVYRKQGPGDLGRRMQRTFEQAFRSGTRRLVLIGTDCPDISTEVLGDAFDQLEENDLVLGPATDGGYYLIGLRQATVQHLPALFDDMPWGADTVLEQTLARAKRHALATADVATLSDVDRPEDL
jgi:rSAM/selenodomain-associated transferase 1